MSIGDIALPLYLARIEGLRDNMNIFIDTTETKCFQQLSWNQY